MTALRSRRDVIGRGGLGVAAGLLASSGTPSAVAEAVANSRYDVRDFGAVGDGATDDTAAIQAAIIAATEGGTVYFPVPTGFRPYVVSTLRMRDRVRLMGETANVVIRKLAGSTGSVICADLAGGRGAFATSFRDLIIDGNAAACPGGTDGIGQHPDDPDGEGYHGDGVQIDNVTFQSCRRHGVSLGHSRSNTTLPLLRNVRATYNRGRGVALKSMSDGWFDIGWVAENGAGGILIETCGALRLSAIQVEGNDDPQASGWMQQARPGIEIVGSGIVFVQRGCTFSSTRTGIVVRGDCTDIDISGNWFNGNNSHGQAGRHPNIQVDAGASRIRGLSVHDNTFHDADDAIVGGGGVSNIRHHVEIVEPDTGSYETVRVAANTLRNSASNPTRSVCEGSGRGIRMDVDSGATATVLSSSIAWTSSAVAVPFSRRVIDPGRQHSSDERSRITIGIGGAYRISGSGTLGGDGSPGRASAVIRVNGRGELCRLPIGGASDHVAAFNGSTIVALEAGDFVELVVSPSPGQSVVLRNVTFSIEPMTS